MKQQTGTMPLRSPYESDKRKMDDVLRRMLNTSPPKPAKKVQKKPA